MATAAKSEPKGGNTKTGKYKGLHAAKMQKNAPPGFKYVVEKGKGKYVPIETKAAPASAAPVKPKEKSSLGDSMAKRMRAFSKDDTAESEFYDALNKTVVEPVAEPAAVTEPVTEGSKTETPGAGGEAPKSEESKAEDETKEEEKPPGYDFKFEFDDQDVEVMLDMIPLITIPLSSLIAWFFGRTLVVENIGMSEFKKTLLRPGVKHYGYRIMQAISNPEFFWTCLVAIIIFDALFNSVKTPPEGGTGDHKNTSNEHGEEEHFEEAKVAA